MMDLLAIVWNPDPVAFSIGPVSVRWYGLIYATGFLIAVTILARIFKHDKCPDDWADKYFIYMVIAVVVGSRLGHVFFYDWAYYKDHLLEIFQVWKGGLASHGGTIAILLTVWLMAKYMCKKPFLWLADRSFVICSVVASMIRIGNLMNSEIYGCETSLPWAFKFVRDFPSVPVELVPACHPTQIYESLAYLSLFALLMWMYWRTDAAKKQGLLTGVGFTWLFVARFLIEFIKNDQSDFEAGMVLNMGQLLSIPFILLGIGLLVYVWRSNRTESAAKKLETDQVQHK
ncbi:MAG: prolipoprotein diacylglyceryl transferase [Paludibacteraceae bacterium]|nr:prolipoprotein diacylglyceryl transferase [Paludibacteraceae bacterium]